MSKAYNLLWKRLSEKYRYKEDFGVVCFYHDEFTVECRKDISEDVKQISERCITDAGEFYKIACPHEGEGKIGEDWYAIH